MKTKKIFILIFVGLLGCASMQKINAAESSVDKKGERILNPCDDILYPGEYLRFSIPNSDGPSYRVDAIDVENDMIYNKVLDAWLPSFSLAEAYPSGYGNYPLDDVLYVGEYFYIDGKFAQLNKTGFYIYEVNATKAKIKLKNKYNQDVYVWVNAAPVLEYNPNGYC